MVAGKFIMVAISIAADDLRPRQRHGRIDREIDARLLWVVEVDQSRFVKDEQAPRDVTGQRRPGSLNLCP